MKKAILFSVLTTCLAFILAGCSAKPTIDFEECVKVEFSGYNDEGYAYICTDNNYMFSVLSDMNTMSAANLISTFSIDNIENNGELSNGDEITLIVNTDSTALDKAKVKVKNTELHFTVEGLKEKPEIDVFSDVSVKVTGSSPYCTVSVEYNGDQGLSPLFSFSVAASDGTEKKYYADGDKVTVSLTETALETLEKDALIKETFKEYTVTAESKYIFSSSDLSDDRAEYLRTAINETVEGKIPEIISGSDRTSQVRIISDLSGISVGTLAASTCNVSSIENLNLNSVYVGTTQEAVGFSDTKEVPYIYFFYDADVSYMVKRFFETIEDTVHGQIVVAISEPVLYQDGQIIYQKMSINAAKDFQTAYNNRANDTFSQLF
ncbi:MAG: hypothetical protein ACI4JS_06240 [Oscillospiraceae bacterium]